MTSLARHYKKVPDERGVKRVHLQRCDVLVVELVFHVSEDAGGLPDAAFAQQHHLEVVALHRRGHLDAERSTISILVSRIHQSKQKNSYVC